MLVNRKVVKAMLEAGEPLSRAVNRATGRSTAIALRALADAIDNPGKPIEVRDHWATHLASVHLHRTARDMADKLGLEDMAFNAVRLTITSNFCRKPL